MTYKQFEHIQGLLEEWRAVRNISVEDQKKNFKVNYTKELIEFFEAERDNNEYETFLLPALSCHSSLPLPTR